MEFSNNTFDKKRDKDRSSSVSKSKDWKQVIGLVLPSSESCGGFQKSHDFGPFGAILKKKIKDLFWNFFHTYNPYTVGYDGAIITSSKIWEISGHLEKFFDWSVDCLKCKKRQRISLDKSSNLDKPLEKFICSRCSSSEYSKPYRYSLLLTTNLGNQQGYLRPETCQGIFSNVFSIQRAIRQQLPFGVVQIGKSFRNEVTLNHGIFRSREFEQMELEFFCLPTEANRWWEYWIQKAWTFLKKLLAPHTNYNLVQTDYNTNFDERIKKEFLKKEELPHYAQKTLDFYFQYSFGWGELCSNSDRGVYDLQQHFPSSPLTQVIEVSFGVERLLLAILENCYTYPVMRFSPLIAPYFVAILAIFPRYQQTSWEIFQFLLTKILPFEITHEKSSSVGKGYYYQDSLGTFFCLTVDQQTLIDQTVTVRYRDSKEQERIAQEDLEDFLRNKYQDYYKKFFSS